MMLSCTKATKKQAKYAFTNLKQKSFAIVASSCCQGGSDQISKSVASRRKDAFEAGMLRTGCLLGVLMLRSRSDQISESMQARRVCDDEFGRGSLALDDAFDKF